MAIGGLIFAAGTIATVIGMASGGSRVIVFWGAMLFGGAQFLYGLTSREEPNPLPDKELDFVILLQALVAAAHEKDGPLDAARIELIRTIMSRILGTDYDTATIADACGKLSKDSKNIRSRLFEVSRRLSLPFRRVIVQASAKVISPDAALNDKQREFVLYMARSLDLPDSEFEALLAAREQFAAQAPARAQPPASAPSITVEYGPWRTAGGQHMEIRRAYVFSGMAGPSGTLTVEIRCRLELSADAGGGLTPFLYFHLAPAVLTQDGELFAQFSPSSTPDDEVFLVRVEAVASNANFVLVDDFHSKDCINVLMLGRQITLRLYLDESRQERLLSVPLENDQQFNEAYSELRRLALSARS